MSKRFRPWKIDEPQLLPASVQDFVAEDHLARFVVSLVTEELNAGGDRSRSNSIHQCVDRALTHSEHPSKSPLHTAHLPYMQIRRSNPVSILPIIELGATIKSP